MRREGQSMNYRTISAEHDPRSGQFALFSQMANPYVGATVEVDVSALRARCLREGLPFFLSLNYCVGRAANGVKELRRRILDGKIVEFARCDTSHTVLREDESYVYCRLNCMQPFADYLPQAKKLHEEAKCNGSLSDGDDVLSLLFVSTLPWIHYSALMQPTPIPADSNPRIVWGKFVETDGRCTLPVTLLVHHGLADGLHIGRFYETLERTLHRFGAGSAFEEEEI